MGWFVAGNGGGGGGRGAAVALLKATAMQRSYKPLWRKYPPYWCSSDERGEGGSLYWEHLNRSGDEAIETNVCSVRFDRISTATGSGFYLL